MKSKPVRIAIGQYVTKHGTDCLVTRTHADDVSRLPPLTNALLEETFGVLEPDIEGEDANEEAKWVFVTETDSLPLL